MDSLRALKRPDEPVWFLPRRKRRGYAKTMRDNHEGMFEFVRAFQKDDHYFLVIAFDVAGETRHFQIGISRRSYQTICRVTQDRPFDSMPGLKYRYFYAGYWKSSSEDRYSMRVRIECGRDGIQKEFEIPKDLHSNLLWFDRLESLSDANYLKVTIN